MIIFVQEFHRSHMGYDTMDMVESSAVPAISQSVQLVSVSMDTQKTKFNLWG